MEVTDVTLRDMLKESGKMSNHELSQLARHMTLALLELNSIKIIHLNIKPTNILVSRAKNGINSYKLTDFYLSRFIRNASFLSTLVLSPCYYAPEVLLTEKYDVRCDVFSLGVVLLECALGRYPFGDVVTYGQLVATERLARIMPTVIQTVDDRFKKLLIRMLVLNPNDRMTVEELCAQPFIAMRLPTVAKFTSRATSVYERLLNQAKQELITNNFDSLDDDVLFKILNYVSLRDRVRFERVTKKMARCSRSCSANARMYRIRSISIR